MVKHKPYEVIRGTGVGNLCTIDSGTFVLYEYMSWNVVHLYGGRFGVSACESERNYYPF